MSENKSFASLDPVLLARKGTAKPAMRIQLGTQDRAAELSDDLEALAAGQDDLGWNDMGDTDNVLTFDDARRLQGKLAGRYHAPRRPVSSKARKAKKADAEGRRAAFTLRLDEERHLKLRLASTINNCSAQALVTEALDKFLNEISDLDGLAKQISRKTNKA